MNHLKNVSARRAEELRTYAKLRKQFLANHPQCQWPGCSAKAKDVHHVRGRSFLLNEQQWWKAVCRSHHHQIHDHPEQARAVGFLAPKGKWLSRD
jgi:hypothetical protein